MESPLAQEFAQAYSEWVRLVGVKVRNRGEVKKLDSAGAPLRCGDPVLIEVEGEAIEVTDDMLDAVKVAHAWVLGEAGETGNVHSEVTLDMSSIASRMGRPAIAATTDCRRKAL